MVLIHGMTDNSRSWSLIAPYFAKAGYHIYMIDLRGHGASDKPDTGMYAISDYAADIANFMDKMGIEKADIVGHSLGSMVSQALLLNFPEKCKSVTLVSSTTVGNGVLGTDYYEYGISLGADGHPDNEFMDAWYYCSAPVDPEFLQYEMAESQALPGYVWECVAGGITFSDMRPFYSFIDTSIPVLIAWGDQDSFFNEDIQKELRANLPQAEFVSYAGIGHNIQWENTEQLANDILNFLGK